MVRDVVTFLHHDDDGNGSTKTKDDFFPLKNVYTKLKHFNKLIWSKNLPKLKLDFSKYIYKQI